MDFFLKKKNKENKSRQCYQSMTWGTKESSYRIEQRMVSPQSRAAGGKEIQPLIQGGFLSPNIVQEGGKQSSSEG